MEKTEYMLNQKENRNIEDNTNIKKVSNFKYLSPCVNLYHGA